jgi:hypothetical protein
MTFKRDPGLPYQKLEEETIVADPRSREVHLLNETATRVWELLASPLSLDELAEALGDEYDAPVGELRKAVAEIIDAFGVKGLLATSSPAGAA